MNKSLLNAIIASRPALLGVAVATLPPPVLLAILLSKLVVTLFRSK
jgi:hypothetical protein